MTERRVARAPEATTTRAVIKLAGALDRAERTPTVVGVSAVLVRVVAKSRALVRGLARLLCCRATGAAARGDSRSRAGGRCQWRSAIAFIHQPLRVQPFLCDGPRVRPPRQRSLCHERDRRLGRRRRDRSGDKALRPRAGWRARTIARSEPKSCQTRNTQGRGSGSLRAEVGD